MRHLDVLLDPALGAIVDMVLWSPERDVFEAARRATAVCAFRPRR